MRQSLTDQQKQIILERDGYACRYCGSKSGPFEFDHVYPVSKGGETSINNIVTACQKCNSRKSNKVGIWPTPLENKKGLRVFMLLLFGLAVITVPLSPMARSFTADDIRIFVCAGALILVFAIIVSMRK